MNIKVVKNQMPIIQSSPCILLAQAKGFVNDKELDMSDACEGRDDDESEDNVYEEKTKFFIDINKINEYRQTALHVAIDNKCISTVELLLNKKLFNEKDINGRIVLHYVHTNIEVLQLILSYDSTNINAEDYHGNTALHYAVEAASYEVVELLLKYGADVNKKNRFGKTALDISKKDNVIKLLKARRIEKQLGYSLLHSIALSGNIAQTISCLSNYKNLIDQQNNAGDTALHLALENKEYQLAKMLVSYRANTDIKNNKGQLPIDLVNDISIIIELLLLNKNYNIERAIYTICFNKRIDISYILTKKIIGYLGNKKKLIKIFTKILKTNSNNITALLCRGEVYRKEKKYQLAIDDFDKVLTVDKNNWEALARLGEIYRVYYTDGFDYDYEKAYSYLEKASNINNNSDWIYLKLGMVKYSYAKSLRLSKTDGKIRILYEEALEIIKKAAQINPNNYNIKSLIENIEYQLSPLDSKYIIDDNEIQIECYAGKGSYAPV